jgi:hypothetical protein
MSKHPEDQHKAGKNIRTIGQAMRSREEFVEALFSFQLKLRNTLLQLLKVR